MDERVVQGERFDLRCLTSSVVQITERIRIYKYYVEMYFTENARVVEWQEIKRGEAARTLEGDSNPRSFFRLLPRNPRSLASVGDVLFPQIRVTVSLLFWRRGFPATLEM